LLDLLTRAEIKIARYTLTYNYLFPFTTTIRDRGIQENFLSNTPKDKCVSELFKIILLYHYEIQTSRSDTQIGVSLLDASALTRQLSGFDINIYRKLRKYNRSLVS